MGYRVPTEQLPPPAAQDTPWIRRVFDTSGTSHPRIQWLCPSDSSPSGYPPYRRAATFLPRAVLQHPLAQIRRRNKLDVRSARKGDWRALRAPAEQ